MHENNAKGRMGAAILMAIFCWGMVPLTAGAATVAPTPAPFNDIRTSGIPDINGWPNWANSPPLRKFVDDLPGVCGVAGATNLLGQCIPKAIPDKLTYPGSDYYEISLVQYREQMHSDLPPLVNTVNPGLTGAALKMDADTTGGTLLRGYIQTNTIDVDASTPHYLGVMIVAEKDVPVRIKFTNALPAGNGGELFIPTDTTVMGSGPGPTADRPWITANVARSASDPTDAEICQASPADCYTQNRGNIHLHGGRSPWISDGTAHQWITPAAEFPAGDDDYAKGDSVAYVPDMWYLPNGDTITSCAGSTTCSVPEATNDPGDGVQTYYYTNAQSARLMFYHDHSWGITRLGVYAGEAAPYIVTDGAEIALASLLPPADKTIPLVIQDKTFVNADTTSPTYILDTDPTWIWGSQPGTLNPAYDATDAAPVTGDLWWPHVYVPAQNPFQQDGINDFGRWHYGPWFWPPTDVTYGPEANLYASLPNQPPQVPSIPNPSWGAEAFMDTPVINGTAYPKIEVTADAYRFRILNAAHDRFFNLQLYVADETANNTLAQPGFPGGSVEQLTEVKMVDAVVDVTYPGHNGDGDFGWPADGREGGVPDPATRGPALVQIASDGGFLPEPAVLKNRPINWNVDPTTFTAGLVLQQNEGGGTLMIGPAERADIVVDFSKFAGKTLILYNDAPAPWPALDPHYDYYTNSPIYSDIGGAPEAYNLALTPTPPGYGPNTRTLMKIVVGPAVDSGDDSTAPVNGEPANLAALQTAFAGPTGIFAKYQDPIVVGQAAYTAIYDQPFPAIYPNWGLSRIIDNSISFMTPEGSIVTAYPMEPKAIQDEMGEVFDEFGRMSAKLGLEMARTTAGIQTFILQNFVDPPTEIVAKDQVQIWKITHNGVDTHPVHFHLFEVQLLNRVGWDGFIYLPDPNELGWKDTVRVSPLEDTIVALRPAKVPTPFNVPNSIRRLNPAYPLNAEDAGFTNLDPLTGEARTTPVINEEINFGHEYLWHCHILSHEEQDMMRVIVSNANSLLYTDNGITGFWQWNRGDWTEITNAAGTLHIDPSSIVSSGSFAYATNANGLWVWNGYDLNKISDFIPTNMVASGSVLYTKFADGSLWEWDGVGWVLLTWQGPDSMYISGSVLYAKFSDESLWTWNGNSWTLYSPTSPNNIVASETALYGEFTGTGIWKANGIGGWTQLSSINPDIMVASRSFLYAKFSDGSIWQWNGRDWNLLTLTSPNNIVISGSALYGEFTGTGIWKANGTGGWTQLTSTNPDNMVASGSVLYAKFSDGSIWVWEFEANGWSLLTGTPGSPPAPATELVPGF